MRLASAVVIVAIAFGTGALYALTRKSPLGSVPPWMIEKLKEKRDDRPCVTLPLPSPPPPPEEDYNPVVSEDEDE